MRRPNGRRGGRLGVATFVLASVLLVASSSTAMAAGKGGKGKAAKAAPVESPTAAAERQVKQLIRDGDYAGALAYVDGALVASPGDLSLMRLRASTLLEMRDFEGALAAYEAFLSAGAKGANRRAAQKIVRNLQAIKTTFVHVTVSAGPANVYLESRTLGVFCVAAPECKRGILPGKYRIYVEKDGFEPVADRITVKAGATVAFSKTLVEKPSLLSITATPAGAQVTLDGKPLGPAPQSFTVPAGDHVLEVRADGYLMETRTVSAHEAKPVEAAFALRPIVPVSVPVADAELFVDDAPAQREGDGIVLPDGDKPHVLVVRAKRYREARVEIPATRPEGYRVDVVLQPSMGALAVAGAPRGATVRVDGKVVGEVPLGAPVAIEPGERAVEVSARGYVTYSTVATIAPEETSQVLVTHMQSTSKKKAWIATAAGGTALVGGVVFGLLAFGAEGDFADVAAEPEVMPDDPRLRDARDRSESWARAADVSFTLAAIGGGLAAWWWTTEGEGASEGRIEPLVGPGTVGVAGRF